MSAMMKTTSAAASAQVKAQAMGSKEEYKMPDVASPSRHEAVYATTSGQYSGTWHEATAASIGGAVGDCPTISEVLALRGKKQQPIRPKIDHSISVLGKQAEEEQNARLADKVLSADKLPQKFPVEADRMSYPPCVKHGGDNPLYSTSSRAYGSETPLAHQISDRYFPSTNKFTKGFPDNKPRFTGLSTKPNPSNVHSSLDTFY